MLKRVIAGSAIAAASWAAYAGVRRWWTTWGVDPLEATRALPGDDLVPVPAAIDTRGITIDAPPEAVWPWLVQMGFGRAGWYSYDQLDMKGRSAGVILPEFQSIAVGDLMPTDPGGGFDVRVVDPGRALVLSFDTASLTARRTAATESLSITDAPGLAASGRLLETATPSDFSASWAFVLDPLEGGRTRLLERFRVTGRAETAGSRLFAPVMGFGVFVMMHRQMLGIRARAERQTASTRAAAGETEVVARASNGHAPALAGTVVPAG